MTNSPPDTALPKNVSGLRCDKDVPYIGSIPYANYKTPMFIFKGKKSTVYITGLSDEGMSFGHSFKNKADYLAALKNIEDLYAKTQDPHYRDEIDFAHRFLAFMDGYNKKSDECVCGGKTAGYVTSNIGHGFQCNYKKA